MEKLIAVIKSVFEDFNEKDFREDMVLEEINGWDSMNSVNLQVALESMFDVNLSDSTNIFMSDSNISDIIAVLIRKGIKFSFPIKG